MALVIHDSVLFISIILIIYEIGQTSTAVPVEKWTGCLSSESKLETFLGVSVGTCAEMCGLTPSCTAFNYLTRVKFCELLSDESRMTEEITQTQPCLHSFRADLQLQQCPCPRDHVCNGVGADCSVKACPMLMIENGDVFGNILTVGSRVDVGCHAGYKRVPEHGPITCVEDGSWTNIPECIASCPDPPTVSNADLLPGNNFIGNMRRYYCNQDTVLWPKDDAVTNTECLQNSTWTTTNFQCLKECGEPDNMTNAILGPSNMSETTERYYKCNEGFQTPLNTNYYIITCQINGTWSPPSSRCIEQPDQITAISYVLAFIHIYRGSSRNTVNVVSAYPTKVKITAPLQDYQEIITVTSATEIHFPDTLPFPSGFGTFPIGLRLESNDTVEVYAESVRVGSTGGSVVIQEKHLSNEYIILSWSQSKNFKAEIAVVGTIADTVVDLVLPNGKRSIFNLNANEMFQYQTLDEISGTFISAAATVAVFAGHECADVVTGPCDPLYEQMPPIYNLQKEYIVSFPYPRYAYALRIIAVTDNTEIILSDGKSVTINRGKYAQYQINDVPIAIIATNKIMVAAYSLGRNSNPTGFQKYFDGSMLIVPGLSQFKPQYHMIVPENVIMCVLMVTYPSYMSELKNIRLNHMQFVANESVEVHVTGRGTYTILYTKMNNGIHVIYTTDGTSFGAYLSFFRNSSESWFSLPYTFDSK